MKIRKSIVCAGILVIAASVPVFGKTGTISTTKSGTISTTRTGTISTTASGTISTNRGTISTTRTGTISTTTGTRSTLLAMDRNWMTELLLVVVGLW